MPGVSLSFLRDRLAGLRSVHLDDLELTELLTQIIDAGGGITIDIETARYRIIRRDNAFVVKPADRSSTHPPPRRR